MQSQHSCSAYRTYLLAPVTGCYPISELQLQYYSSTPKKYVTFLFHTQRKEKSRAAEDDTAVDTSGMIPVTTVVFYGPRRTGAQQSLTLTITQAKQGRESDPAVRYNKSVDAPPRAPRCAYEYCT